MSIHSSLCRKVELTFESLFKTKSFPDGVNIYRGFSNQVKEGPCVIVFAKGGSEDPINTGNYRVQVFVTVKGLADPDDQAEAVFNALDSAVEKILADDLLKQELNEVETDDFTIIGLLDKGPDSDVETLAWHSVYELEVYCCASNL